MDMQETQAAYQHGIETHGTLPMFGVTLKKVARGPQQAQALAMLDGFRQAVPVAPALYLDDDDRTSAPGDDVDLS
jgi:hypothetical protein